MKRLVNSRQELRVAPDRFRVHHRDEDGEIPKASPKGGIMFDFPVSPRPDPDATPPWVGYVVGFEKKNLIMNGPGVPIRGSHLVYEFQLTGDPAVQFNYMSDPDNNRGDPARFKPFLKTGNWQQMGTRWWSLQAWELKVNSGFVTFDVSLDPSNWHDVSGILANTSPEATREFLAVVKRPTYYGVTFSGGLRAGHGANISGGKATFNLYRMYSC